MEKSWPGDPRHPPLRAIFPTIAYKSSSAVYMRNCKPGSGVRVALGVGSLGLRDRVALGGEPTFSHVNGFKRVNSPSRAKSRHAEHAQADISYPDPPSKRIKRETPLLPNGLNPEKLKSSRILQRKSTFRETANKRHATR